MTERRERDALAPRTVALRVTRGPDTGAELLLQMADRVLVGTSTTCTMRLTDQQVSRRHASFELAGEGLVFRDLGSTNGSFVRRLRVREAVLEPGDVVEIGETHLVAVDVEAPPPVAPAEAESFGGLEGKSLEMRRLFALASRIAASEMNVLIEGETGTGKDRLAEALHAASARAEQPLIEVEVAGEDPHGIGVLLFGAAPGVLPSSPEGRPGILETARGGAVLLDEPATLPADIQRRLARALSRRETERIGGADPVPIDVRVYTTTVANLDRLVERGLLREDLFFILAGARLELPPLRKRMEDVPVLAKRFWAQAQRTEPMPQELLGRLTAHSWPGNVRELENAIARHVTTGELDVAAWSKPALSTPTAGGPSADFVSEVLARKLPLVQARNEVVVRFERVYLERVLRDNGGNVTHAARAAGVALRYFQTLKAKRRTPEGETE